MLAMPLAVKARGKECALPHLTEEHADLVKTIKVNRTQRDQNDRKREDG